MPSCEFCGEEFDTERGLHIHQSQKHEDEKEREEKESVSAGTTKGPVTFSINVHYALILAFAVGILTGGFGMATLYGMNEVTGAVAAPTQDDTGNNDAGAQPSDPGVGEIPIEGEPVLGDADAPVTIVLYEDFECPFCQRFEQNAGKQIVSNYVDAGEVKIVWKDFPLTSIHPWAQPAAETMECVYRQDEDAFWTVKDTVFDNQDSLSRNNAASMIVDWARQEGVSASAVQSCLESGDAQEEVNQDMQEGRSLGVSGTPTAFVNGQKIVGAQPFSAFQQVIEAELN